MGKQERQRIAGLREMEPQPRLNLQEIAMDRGVSLLPERGGAFTVLRSYSEC